MNDASTPILQTERLLMRPLRESDEEEIFLLRSDDRVNRFLDRPKQTLVAEARAFIHKINNGLENREWFYWALELKGSPKLVGTACIWNISADKRTGELGYELRPDFQGKGIMMEALGRIIDFAFRDIGLLTLEAYTHRDNTASTKLLLKQGFKPETERGDPENPNLIIFSLSSNQ